MFRNPKSLIAFIFACFFVLAASRQVLAVQDHVVSQPGLRQAMMNSAATRQSNIRKVEDFLSSQPIQKIVKKNGFNLKQVKQAVPSLSNQELAQLAERSGKIQSAFAAGSLTHGQITYLLVAATVIIILIIALAA